MKKLLFFSLFMLFYCTVMYSQERISDAPFSNSSSACYIDDTFVKSFIGFNMLVGGGLCEPTKESLEKPIIINGITYKAKISMKSERKINFVTLDDLRKEYAPNVTGKVIYMINEYVITTDEQSYKLDRDFIDCCELLKSSDFDTLKDTNMNLSILRVYTKPYVMARIRIRGAK